MTSTTSPVPAVVTDRDTAQESPRSGAVSAWVQLLARTLKTCRLYDGENPTVIKFRAELARELRRLLENAGPLTLRFTSSDVLHGEISAYPARSREDNLAQPFYRDGIRAITFQPGIEPSEVEGFLDQLLRVGRPVSGDEDLVTLLWEANLDHLDIDYLPTDGDIECGGEGGQAGSSAPAVPWPGPSPRGEGETSSSKDDGAAVEDRTWGRSDDWQTGDEAIDVELAFARLESAASSSLDRFRREFEADESEPTVRSALRVISDSLAAQPNWEDRLELGQFLPRVLREAIRVARWAEAREALALLRSCDALDWSVPTLTRELLGPYSVVTPECVATLDRQSSGEVEGFLTFARELGPEGTEWLMTVLAQSQQKLVRRPLTRVIAELCQTHPEPLRPWLSNPQWYVVRNVVHICGWIGGDKVVGLIREAVDHPEPRVRQEVVAVLSQVDRSVARPILFDMLDAAEGGLFGAVLFQLSQERDPVVSKRLLDYLLDGHFGARPAEEKRAVYSAMATSGGDEVLPALEAELRRGGWISRSPGSHRLALARCLARIGSPAALAVLHRGARSWRTAVRRACATALEGTHVGD